MNTKMKPALIAFIVASAFLICTSALLFLPKETTQLYAITDNLWTVGYPADGDWFRSSGIEGNPGEGHIWNHTTYGLYFHWHATDVATDDPREFYSYSDPLAVLVYAFFALVIATISWLGAFTIVRLRRSQNNRAK